MLIEGGGGEDRFFPTGNRRSGFSLTRGGEYTWTEFFRKAVSRNGPALFFYFALFNGFRDGSNGNRE